MITLNLVLSIIASSLKIAEKTVELLTPEQVANFLERHEARMAFWERLADRFKDDK